MADLPPRAAAVLAKVHELTFERGYPPTLSEVAAACRIGKPTAQVHIEKLRSLAKLRRDRGRLVLPEGANPAELLDVAVRLLVEHHAPDDRINAEPQIGVGLRAWLRDAFARRKRKAAGATNTFLQWARGRARRGK